MWTVHLSPFIAVILCISQIGTGTSPSFIKRKARLGIPSPNNSSYSDSSETKHVSATCPVILSPNSESFFNSFPVCRREGRCERKRHKAPNLIVCRELEEPTVDLCDRWDLPMGRYEQVHQPHRWEGYGRQCPTARTPTGSSAGIPVPTAHGGSFAFRQSRQHHWR